MNRTTLQTIFEARERRIQADSERDARRRQLALTLREWRRPAAETGLALLVGLALLCTPYATLVLAP